MNKFIACLLSVCLMSTLLNAQNSTDKKETSKQDTSSSTKEKSATSPQKQGDEASDEKSTKQASGKKDADPKKPWISVASPALKKKVSEITKKLKAPEKKKLLKFLNEGKPTELVKVPGIGKVRAANLVKGRPYKAVDDIIDITGIGEKTFGQVIAHVKKL